jgi:hypothetical protein
MYTLRVSIPGVSLQISRSHGADAADLLSEEILKLVREIMIPENILVY